MGITNDSTPDHDKDQPVPDDAGTDADVDPGLVVPSPDDTARDPNDPDAAGSTNRTGLTPDSIQVD